MTALDTRSIRYPQTEPPEEGAAIEVAEGILWLRMPLPMRLDHVNVYALDDGDGWTVVDTGFDTRRGRAAWDAALAGPLAGKPVRRVLVTHHHPDHIGLAGWFAAEHGAELVTTRIAWLTARMLHLDEQPMPLPETVRFWTAAGMDPAILRKRSGERPFNSADCVAPIPLGFTRIGEGSRIAVGGRDWIVRIGHGHAPEHATLWSEDGALVLGGDQLLPSISPNISVHATEPEADPVGEWLESCAKLAPFAAERQLVLPGHKLPFYGLPTRIAQLAENHTGALARLEAFLDRPKAAGECFQPIFLRDVGGSQYGLALGEAFAHCLHLWHAGRATREIGGDGVWRFQRSDAV